MTSTLLSRRQEQRVNWMPSRTFPFGPAEKWGDQRDPNPSNVTCKSAIPGCINHELDTAIVNRSGLTVCGGRDPFFCCLILDAKGLHKKPMEFCQLERSKLTTFEKASKCRIWMLLFSTNFYPNKRDLSGNTVLKNSPKWIIFGIFN